MAYITKRGDKWLAEVCIDRKRRSKTFKTKREAVTWSNEQENSGILAQRTLRDAFKNYTEIAESHKGYQSELSRIKTILAKARFADTLLENITPAMIARYRDDRLKEVSPVSVRRELIILGALFNICKDEWCWINKNPIDTIKKPVPSKPRRRGISQNEIDAICKVLETMATGKQVLPMFLLSIETGMRLGELCSIRWEDVTEKTVTLRDTKNGDRRTIPLSVKAREILESRKGIYADKPFDVSPSLASRTFCRARDDAGCPTVHLHDARSEAITRLSKKVDVLQLARIVGHRDLRSLMIYYATTADEIADFL